MDVNDGASRSFGPARQEHILDELRRSGSVRVSLLSRELGVSELTIRRDVAALAERGLLRRVHGGAILRSPLDSAPPRDGVVHHPTVFRIGMVVPSLTYYWPAIIAGAQAAVTRNGSELAVRAATYSALNQRRQIMSLLEEGTVHGLIAAPATDGSDGRVLLNWLAGLPVPVVLAERRASSSAAFASLEWATTDHVHGGVLAVQHFAALGHRRVGLVTSEGSPTSGSLKRGWDHAVGELDLTSTVHRNFELDAITEGERDELLRSLLEECSRTRTTALLIHSDRQAVHVQRYARDSGVNVPEDLTIVAYDDETAAGAEPPISALRPPKEDVGRVAAELLLSRLAQDPARARQHVYLLPEFRRRGTVSVRVP